MYKITDETIRDKSNRLRSREHESFPPFICDVPAINYFHTQNENCKYALLNCDMITF